MPVPPCARQKNPGNPRRIHQVSSERREHSSSRSRGPHRLRKLPRGRSGGHDDLAVVRSGGRGGRGEDRTGAGSGHSSADREALERALSDVKPLSRGSKKRVMPAPATARRGTPTSGANADTTGRAARDRTRGQRHRTREAPLDTPSILDALEDPTLEVQAECDLHGQTAREAEREVLRFVRECSAEAVGAGS